LNLFWEIIAGVQTKLSSTPEAGETDLARVAGRGTVYITAAKLWFLVSGYGINFVLPRLMTPDEFGQYKVVVGIVSVINAVVITGTYQTVSKFVSQEPAQAGAVKRAALRLQLLVGGGASLGFLALAPVISHYLRDVRLTGLFRIASLIILAYAFYAVFTGYLNGQRRFPTQAALDAGYSTMKLAFILLLVVMGFGVAGGVSGFALAAAAVLGLSMLAAGRADVVGSMRAGTLFSFQAYLLVFTLVLNLLQKVDLILIKALSSADATAASENAAYYAAALDLANVTYQVVISATFVVFPLVSKSTFAADGDRTRVYIATTVKYTLIVMAVVATLFSANASEVLHVVYRQAYQAGGPALQVVSYGMLLYGLLIICTTIITASGRPRVSIIIGVAALAASAVLNWALIPRYGIAGAAMGTTAAMAVGACAGMAYLIRRFGRFASWTSLARIVGCAAVIYAISIAIPLHTRLGTLVKLSALGIGYVGLLIASRELTREDLKLVAGILGRG
jgi:O-antigen/teichoic acid export membrane protein